MNRLFFVPEGTKIRIDEETSVEIKKINDGNTADIRVVAPWSNNAGSFTLNEIDPIIITSDTARSITIIGLSVMKSIFSAVNIKIDVGYGPDLVLTSDQRIYLKNTSIATVAHQAAVGDKITILKPSGATIDHEQADGDDQTLTIPPSSLDEEGIWTVTHKSNALNASRSIFFRVEESYGTAYTHILEARFRPLSKNDGLLGAMSGLETTQAEIMGIFAGSDAWDFSYIEPDVAGDDVIIRIKTTASPADTKKMAAVISSCIMSISPETGYPVGYVMREAVSDSLIKSGSWTVSELMGIMKGGLKTRIDRGADPVSAGHAWKTMVASCLPKTDLSGLAVLPAGSTKENTIDAFRLVENSATTVYDPGTPPPASVGVIKDTSLPMKDKVIQLYGDHKREFQIAAAILILVILLKIRGRRKGGPPKTITAQPKVGPGPTEGKS